MSYEKHQPFSYNNLQIYCSDMQRPRGKQTKKWTNKQKTTKKLFQISSKLLRWKLSCQGVKKMPLHFSAENASVNVQIIIFWNIWNSDFFFFSYVTYLLLRVQRILILRYIQKKLSNIISPYSQFLLFPYFFNCNVV